MPEEPEVFIGDDDDATLGDYLKEPGRYHVVVVDVEEVYGSSDYGPWTANAVTLEVLAGPERGKQTDQRFFQPDGNDGSKDDDTRKVRRRFWRSCGAVTQADVGKQILPGEVWERCKGRNLVMEFEQNGKFLRLAKYAAGMGMFPATDKAVADVPKSDAVLKYNGEPQQASQPAEADDAPV